MTVRFPRPSELATGGFYRRAWSKLQSRISRQVRGGGGYAQRLEAERTFYRNCENVHDLPQIFHYWSNKYLAPKFAALGFTHPDAFFAKYLLEAYHASRRSVRRYISVGAGNCDTEVRLARILRDSGATDFVIECMDINASMLERGMELARTDGVLDHVKPCKADFNTWKPQDTFDGIIANQSLHHVVNLEGLFASVRGALEPGALFVVSDIIGRNGHLRWPEALTLVREYWKEMPKGHRYNQQLSRYEEEFLDWDCSKDGFEGIRAQDILPLLIENFDFDMFAGFANIVDPFIDRSFGHNFDASARWDRAFIDRVHARDEAEMHAGTITPTHMMAVMCVGRRGKGLHLDGMSPGECVRCLSK